VKGRQGRRGSFPSAINRNGQALEGISDSDTATGQRMGATVEAGGQSGSCKHAAAGDHRCTETQFILN
jgi:hypothetical protein